MNLSDHTKNISPIRVIELPSHIKHKSFSEISIDSVLLDGEKRQEKINNLKYRQATALLINDLIGKNDQKMLKQIFEIFKK